MAGDSAGGAIQPARAGCRGTRSVSRARGCWTRGRCVAPSQAGGHDPVSTSYITLGAAAAASWDSVGKPGRKKIHPLFLAFAGAPAHPPARPPLDAQWVWLQRTAGGVGGSLAAGGLRAHAPPGPAVVDAMRFGGAKDTSSALRQALVANRGADAVRTTCSPSPRTLVLGHNIVRAPPWPRVCARVCAGTRGLCAAC